MEEPVIRVLIVEDEARAAKSITRALSKDGFAFSHAFSIAEAKVWLSAGLHDVVLLDLNLPDSVGVETVRRVRGLTKAPIVIFTGMVMDPDDQLALDSVAAGADFYVEKPADIATIRRALRMSLLRKKLEANIQGPEDICRRIARVERDGAAVCYCVSCDRLVFMVEANIGPLVCPHCCQRSMLLWGEARIDFKPELPPKFLRLIRVPEPEPESLITSSEETPAFQSGPTEHRKLVVRNGEERHEEPTPEGDES